MESFLTPYGLSNSGQEKLQFTPFWGGPKPGCSDGLCTRTIKSHNFFVLGPIIVKFHIQTRLSNNLSDVVVRRRKVVLHTSSHLTPTEAWRSPDSTTSEGRRVSTEVRLGNCTQVLGWAKWKAWDSRLRKNSTSHLFWLVQICLKLRKIQSPCTLVLQCQFFALSNALILQSYVLSWWNCIF